MTNPFTCLCPHHVRQRRILAQCLTDLLYILIAVLALLAVFGMAKANESKSAAGLGGDPVADSRCAVPFIAACVKVVYVQTPRRRNCSLWPGDHSAQQRAHGFLNRKLLRPCVRLNFQSRLAAAKKARPGSRWLNRAAAYLVTITKHTRGANPLIQFRQDGKGFERSRAVKTFARYFEPARCVVKGKQSRG
jgi:hypothetical protein